MIRKPIQIVTSTRPDGDADVYALCNDGTIWQLCAGWVEMPAIPQDESKDPLAKLYAENVAYRKKIVELRSFLSHHVEVKNGMSRLELAHNDVVIADKMFDDLPHRVLGQGD